MNATISKATLQFLKELEKNNNKEWFDANKAKYDVAKKDFELFVTALVNEIIKFDDTLKGIVPAKLIFRIYRDIRFSKDKTPYKNNMGAYLVQGGKQGLENTAGYYIHIQPGASFLAGGAYQPPAPWLKAIREGIDADGKTLTKILTNKSFSQYLVSEGESLLRPPQGFDAEHPYIELLKRKSHIATHYLKDAMVVNEDFIKHAVKVFKAMQPLNTFLNECKLS